MPMASTFSRFRRSQKRSLAMIHERIVGPSAVYGSARSARRFRHGIDGGRCRETAARRRDECQARSGEWPLFTRIVGAEGWLADHRGVGSPFLPEVSGLSCCPQGAYVCNNRNRRRMCRPLATYSSHGLNSGTPNAAKSLTLRVTSVRSLASAVAPKKPSITDSATPLRRLCAIRSPQCSATA